MTCYKRPTNVVSKGCLSHHLDAERDVAGLLDQLAEPRSHPRLAFSTNPSSRSYPPVTKKRQVAYRTAAPNCWSRLKTSGPPQCSAGFPFSERPNSKA